MAFDVVRGNIKNLAASESLIQAISAMDTHKQIEGTLFLGYPLSATYESSVTIDGLLITKDKGLIVFIFNDKTVDMFEQQDLMFYQLTNALTKYERLRKRRELAFVPNVITLFPPDSCPENNETYLFCDVDSLEFEYFELPDFDPDLYEILVESLQKISSMKPKKKRPNVVRDDSFGGIIKKIEAEIANLDQWQKKAAYEVCEGPQRIRGLAGSGKTVVLALKAAYMHSEHPEWNIAVTFYTRSLSQQFKDMITNFYYEFRNDLPNWEKLHILHAWGTNYEPGIYSDAASRINFDTRDFKSARIAFGYKHAFNGVCKELINGMGIADNSFYDMIIMDEAQDMPSSFFRLCYLVTKKPKRITFAFDELQNLNNDNMPSTIDMFGNDGNGDALVNFDNEENEARRDIALPICYRNTHWALTIAHALGFGIYHKGSIIQLFEDLDLWSDIGYKIVSGELAYGKQVKLARKEDSYPKFFSHLLTPESAIIARSFDNMIEQYQWVSNEIQKNILEDELDPDDILVIFPDAYLSKSQYIDFRKILLNKNIQSILAGVSVDKDTFREEGSITCSSIYRAKGNEAPMVYILNSELCVQGVEMITLRNTLFTAITRSRAWVRICGISPDMKIILDEIEKCKKNDYALNFKVPTVDELKRQKLIHRDRSDEEKKKLKHTSSVILDLIKSIETGEMNTDILPELKVLINKLKISEEIQSVENDE